MRLKIEMVKAIWNGEVIAESDTTVELEGNHYFPRESVNPAFLLESSTKSVCPWKGQASYYSLSVNGKSNPDAAWYYPDPSAAAAEIKDHLAFWRGVSIG